MPGIPKHTATAVTAINDGVGLQIRRDAQFLIVSSPAQGALLRLPSGTANAYDGQMIEGWVGANGFTITGAASINGAASFPIPPNNYFSLMRGPESLWVLYLVDNLGNGSAGVTLLRTVPVSTDTYYVVQRDGATAATVLKMIREVGGSAGGSNLGGPHPEWRVGGVGNMALFANNPATQTTWLGDENGAWDLIGRSSDGDTLYGSFHGLGTGSLISQQALIDGATFDHTVPNVGNSYYLRNKTNATNGTDALMRELTITSENGAMGMECNDILATNMSYVRFGMPIGSGTGFDEADTRIGTAWKANHLRSVSANLVDFDMLSRRLTGARIRNSTTGGFIQVSGTLGQDAGYAQGYLIKRDSDSRTKLYYGQYTSGYSSLIGKKLIFSWGVGASGTVSPGTNLIDPNFTVGASPGQYLAYTASNGTVAFDGTDLIMTYTTGTSNLRVIPRLTGLIANTQTVSVEIDYVSDTALGTLREFYASSTVGGSGTPPLGFLISQADMRLGKRIVMFETTIADQPAVIRNANSVASVTKWRNPRYYAHPA